MFFFLFNLLRVLYWLLKGVDLHTNDEFTKNIRLIQGEKYIDVESIKNWKKKKNRQTHRIYNSFKNGVEKCNIRSMN